jgi:hypothetical protein
MSVAIAVNAGAPAPRSMAEQPPGTATQTSETTTTVENDDRFSLRDSSLHTDEDAPRRRLRHHSHVWTATRIIIFLSPLILLFCLAIASAVLNWNKYQSLQYEFEWTTRSCLVVFKRAARDTSMVAEASLLIPIRGFRGEVGVRDYGLENASEVVTAFVRADDTYSDSRDSIQLILDGISVGKPAERAIKSMRTLIFQPVAFSIASCTTAKYL